MTRSTDLALRRQMLATTATLQRLRATQALDRARLTGQPRPWLAVAVAATGLASALLLVGAGKAYGRAAPAVAKVPRISGFLSLLMPVLGALMRR